MRPLKFDNRFLAQLPVDPETQNFRRQVEGACCSLVSPTPTSAPKLVAYSAEVAESLGLSEDDCQSDEFLRAFSGNQLLPGMESFANCYGGHQFGNWAGQLGDGRAMNIGELVHNGQRQTLQLKGAGPTPYSRTADGLAVLRSSVREFLCSEAMFHLGVPTTRALSLCLTGDLVARDMFYDGDVKDEQGAVVCRVAPSFTRFGSFEIFASRGDVETLKSLANYTIKTDFPYLLATDQREADLDVYLKWFQEICDTTAEMVVHWMRVGFVHGVMNTDNMSIHGLTIDYGPYGWLEDYDPLWTPNTTDAQGRRYCFENQPKIAHWNLYQLANALLPLLASEGLEGTEALETILNSFGERYVELWQGMMASKLGIKTFEPVTDQQLVDELFQVLQLVETDMTIFYRELANLDMETEDDDALLASIYDAYYQAPNEDATAKMLHWLKIYRARLQKENEGADSGDNADRIKSMNAVNPKYVLRNFLAQLAIDQAEEGDFSLVEEQLDVLRKPYEDQPGKEAFAEKRPEWARDRAGCSMLSCSS